MTEQKKIVVKRPGQQAEIVLVDHKYRCELKEIIDAQIVETVPLHNGIIIAVDEDGHPKQLPYNFYARMNNEYYPIQLIVGTAVFTKFKPIPIVSVFEEIYDYELDSLSDEEIIMVLKELNSDNQTLLQEQFKKRYTTMADYLKPKVIEF